MKNDKIDVCKQFALDRRKTGYDFIESLYKAREINV